MQKGRGAECLCVFSAFPQIEATLLRSAECEEVQRVAECCWHLAWRTSEPRRRLWQGHRGKHKWELMAPLFRVIRRALHHTTRGRHYWAQLTSCTYVHKGGRRDLKSVAKIGPSPTLLRHKLQLAHTMWWWDGIDALPVFSLRELFMLAHTNTRPCVWLQVFCKYLLPIFPHFFFKWKGIMEIQDKRPEWSWCSAHPFSIQDFFLLCECIVLLQIITIKKPLIPHSVKLIELRKKCNDSN